MSMAEQTIIKSDSYAHERNKELLEKEERELEALLKGEQVDEEAEDNQEPDSESSENTQVSDESDTKQKETRSVESKEPEEVNTESDGLSAEEKSFKKRYGDIRKLLQNKEKDWEAKFEKLQGQLEKATKNELVLPKSKEEIEAWTAKYPDVAGIVEAIAENKAAEKASSLDSRLKEIEELRVQAKKEKAEAELMSLHPDFEEIRSSDEFHNWAEKQPKVIQDALYENSEDAKSVAVAIDLYKSHKGIKFKPNNSADKAAASSVKSKSRTTVNDDESKNFWRESTVAKMSDKEFEKHHEEIHEAQKSGKFIYDLSK
jgi:hypothetical protein